MSEQPQPAGPAGQHLVELFQRAAREYADRPAVADDARTISYAQLDARSTVLARALVRRGVRRGDRVAVYRQRGVDVFVALLGILKAGAAYVAIDVRYPDARRDLMLHGSGATLVVTEPGWRDRFDGLAVEPVEWHSEDVTEPVAGSGIPLCPTDMACVLFTSGSSGVPKAITLEHRNLVHLARNSMLAPLSPTDRFGQVASLSFDTFHIEAWCSLTSGAAVVVLPTMPELVAGDVQRQLRRRRVTALVAPTMAVNHVVHEDREAFSSLRVLYTGGDVLEPAAARTLLSGGFRGEFYNLYGPTEATTCCTTHHVAEVPEGCDNIPIGRELDGATVYVLDPDLNPVGDGELGELFIGGLGVGRGYLGQPAMTADKFRPDPFGAPGGRMYATGDRTRRLPDGTLEFRGRLDEQVKIRGYRVEPREAERAIVRHPSVREAAVIVTGEAHDRRLVALVALHERRPPQELRDFVAATLPDFLVPSAFVVVPEIPGNHHGKRDLTKLYELATEHLRRETGRFEPTDDVERYLVGLWGRLLGVEWIGEHDDFFALGGNSMLAFRARLRIERDLAVRVSVEDILNTTELRGLAALIRAHRTAGEPAPDPATGAARADAALSLSS